MYIYIPCTRKHAKKINHAPHAPFFKPFPISFPIFILTVCYLIFSALCKCPPSPRKKRRKTQKKGGKKRKISPICMLKRKCPITLKKIVGVKINIINLLTKFLQFFKLNYNFWNTFVTGRPLRHSPLGKLACKAKLPPSPGFPPPQWYPSRTPFKCLSVPCSTWQERFHKCSPSPITKKNITLKTKQKEFS